TALADDVKPLRALLITGGGYHDYQKQKTILTEGISARANVEWTVVLENPARGAMPKLYVNKDWAKGYDIIVHNDCFASYSDAETIERIVQDHVDNKVGVLMIHCAMHTFRDTKTKAWDKLVGVESRRHGAKYPIMVRNLGRQHPITKDLPRTWTTPQGELYATSILPDSVELGVGFKEGEEAKTKQVCIWASEYENIRTFGTTMGHHNETMQEKVYLDLVTNGLLWSCHKLDDEGKPLKGYGKTAQAHPRTKFQVYLANGKLLNFASEAELAAADLPELAVPCCGR
ncbi:unnamed protein product, partial [marine sediment metagenome]